MAIPILIRSLAFSVAFSGSRICTQEHCSLMLTNSKRYLFKPASSQAALKSGSWVVGVQEATTTRFKLYSVIAFFIVETPSSEQVNRLRSACTTLGSSLTYSTTWGTSTYAPIFVPQWHTKTPMRVSPILAASCQSLGCSSCCPRPLHYAVRDILRAMNITTGKNSRPCGI